MKNELILIALVSAAPLVAAVPPEVTSFEVSSDERATALIVDNPFRLRLVEDDGDRSIVLSEINAVKDVKPDPEVSWSGDGKYLAIRYASSEEDTVVNVVDASTLEVIWKTPATSAAWLDQGHTLILVPLYPLDGTQVTPGLIRFDAATGRTDVVAAEHFFTGDMDPGSHVLLARTVSIKDDLPVFGVTRIDLDSGLSSTFP